MFSRPLAPATLSLVLLGAFTSAGHAQDVAVQEDAPLDFENLPTLTSHRIDLEVEALNSDDVNVNTGTVTYELESGAWTLLGSIGTTNHSIDYVPNETGFSNHRNEDTTLGSLTLERSWNDHFSTSISGRYYKGFTDFRSLWTSEFFRQLFGTSNGYEEADPRGYSISLGNTYTYANGLGSISVDLGFSSDTVAPGWEQGLDATFRPLPEIESSREDLDTISGSILWDHTVNSWLKTQQSLRLSEVTDRQLRVQYTTKWAFILSDTVSLKAEFGAAYERPDFEAYFGGISVNYRIHPKLELTLGGRLYSDTGEIASSNFNTAAPGFDSSEISLSARWTDGFTTVSGSVGYFDTHFDESGVENLSIANLYSNRDFLSFRAAISRNF